MKNIVLLKCTQKKLPLKDIVHIHSYDMIKYIIIIKHIKLLIIIIQIKLNAEKISCYYNTYIQIHIVCPNILDKIKRF